MKRGWLMLAMLFLLTAVGSFAAVKLVGTKPVPGSCPAPGFAVLQDYLELTEEQRLALAAVDESFARERAELRERFVQARERLVEVLRDPDSTVDDALEAARIFGEAQQAMQTNTIRYTYELRKHLTPAQRERMVGTVCRGICAVTGGPCGVRGMGRRGACPCSGADRPGRGGRW